MAHDHEHSELSETELRVRALETILLEKGYIDPAALDLLVQRYEKKIGPRNGARVVAKAWLDDAFRQKLLVEPVQTLASLGYTGMQGEHTAVVENTPTLHNIVVCTLCSCYPWPLLGLPPIWYKSSAYRARTVADPRGVLRELGLDVLDDVEVRVWDSNAASRYLVLPERPPGTEALGEAALAALVTRDAMIGVARVTLPVSERS